MRDSFEVSKIFKPIIFADNKTFSFFVYENIRECFIPLTWNQVRPLDGLT